MVDVTAVPIEHAGDGRAEHDSSLRRLVALVTSENDPVTLTVDGRAVAVVIDAEQWDSIVETLDIIRTPGSAEALDEGIADLDAGREYDGRAVLDELRRHES